MKHIYAFEKKEEYEKYQSIIDRFSKKLVKFQSVLEKDFALRDLPKGIVWTSEELATTTFSNLPIPAFTNKDLIYISPDLPNWRRLFVDQLEGRENANIKTFYENLSEEHIFTIVGHELTHHSDLFMDEFDDEREDGIWFEEGMCEYLPRKLVLDEREFTNITNVEQELVDVFKDKYGDRSLEEFGSASYQGSLSSIMYDYWRSFLAITYIVEEKANHDIHQVFRDYHKWHNEGRKVPLTEYFGVQSLFV
ncbi:elongation factor Tu [Oceanobacillus picturae]|uniref:Elongation factor Tu n=1 Tax=Oceanobacillus picturae TaxID=171693 RepID=A0A0U9H8P1_9BACI|nr:hypothetical protein [Oceanobacillus picturae]GAQ18153.1 elongation factor Tu [Oceanobacillus picturae]